jgi:Fe-S-cluster-containing hydrogenase component 2
VQKVLVVDPERCTGCRLCEVVCSLHHEKSINPYRSRIRIVKWEGVGVYVPMVCQHCESPVCEAVCPMKAISRDPSTGAVVINYDRCVGCKLCVLSCPLGGASIDLKTRKVVKCDLCNGKPQCVRFCLTNALEFLEPTVANLTRRKAAVERYSEIVRRIAI